MLENTNIYLNAVPFAMLRKLSLEKVLTWQTVNMKRPYWEEGTVVVSTVEEEEVDVDVETDEVADMVIGTEPMDVKMRIYR
eukprot:1497866-Ditylum_brightwellii.AAC.1